MSLPVPSGFALEPARAEDFEALLALRMRAMRPSLEQLGRFDLARGRERLAESFEPAHSWHIVRDDAAGRQRVGFVIFKHLSHAFVLKGFYIDVSESGRGLGSRVLAHLCALADQAQLPIELTALKGSAANRLYLRHGFIAIGEGEWDIDYVRRPLAPSVRVVRALWRAFQARDWAAARALLDDGLQARWWASGERFTNADAFIDAQRRYPEGWTIHGLECERLEDGRVFSLVRVDQPPASFFASSFFRLDDGLITAVDEYWATVEAPPAWRSPEAFPGITRFDPRDDARATPP